MNGQQLELFDVNDAPNEVDAPYELRVWLSFNRTVGNTFNYGSIKLADETADSLAGLLPAIRTFLQQLGFTYVEDVIVVCKNGTEHAASDAE
jgi:hypothetical protein